MGLDELLRGVEEYRVKSYPRGSVRLDLNESPFPPPKEVIDAIMREALRVNRYPEGDLLREAYEALSLYTGLQPDYIAITSGGDAALLSVFSLLSKPGERVVMPRYTFTTTRTLARAFGASVTLIPLRENGDEWVLDEDRLFEEARRAKMILVDNPNNPTGSLIIGMKRLAELAEETEAFIVVDEAYFEFSGETLAAHIGNYDNLIIIRTLSKAFSLAGLRIGYILAPPLIARALRALSPFPTSRLALAALKASIDKVDAARSLVEYITREKDRVRSLLGSKGIKVYKSMTNFLLIDTGLDNAALLLQQKYAVYVKGVEISNTMIRASIGKKEDNDVLVNSLKELTGNQ